jgi:hypothetical protein
MATDVADVRRFSLLQFVFSIEFNSLQTDANRRIGEKATKRTTAVSPVVPTDLFQASRNAGCHHKIWMNRLLITYWIIVHNLAAWTDPNFFFFTRDKAESSRSKSMRQPTQK